MSAGVSWYFDRKRLDEPLDRWRAMDPPETDEDAVTNALMDLLQDPMNWGEKDSQTEAWSGKATENILISYLPNPETGSIGVADISYI